MKNVSIGVGTEIIFKKEASDNLRDAFQTMLRYNRSKKSILTFLIFHDIMIRIDMERCPSGLRS